MTIVRKELMLFVKRKSDNKITYKSLISREKSCKSIQSVVNESLFVSFAAYAYYDRWHLQRKYTGKI